VGPPKLTGWSGLRHLKNDPNVGGVGDFADRGDGGRHKDGAQQLPDADFSDSSDEAFEMSPPNSITECLVRDGLLVRRKRPDYPLNPDDPRRGRCGLVLRGARHAYHTVTLNPSTTRA
jgi:hypothetical protein